ncbi:MULTISPECIES: kelch repeat-containing protein [Frankia]|uniref:Kelch repeat-containing protein n=1 Tax=Frankia TaxID=1854 RepID=UPI000707EF7B|nr:MULTISPECIES: kelch repeat-containing protein [unclassified Frankia]KQM04578.1 Kelch motif protein [Frankia sp. CpI1-P]
MGTVQVFDPGKKAWTDAAGLPTPRTHLAAATGTDGRIYAIGGRSGAGNDPTDTVEVYTPSSGTWTSGTALPKPMGEPRATRATDGKIYVLDGDTLAIYDPDAASWTTADAPPTPVTAPVLTALPDGRILAAGGSAAGGGPTGRASSGVYAYTPGTGGSGSWTQVSDLPTGVTQAAGATGPDGRVYVVGGRDAGGDVTDAVQVYSPDDDQWTAGPTGAAAKRADAAATTGGDGRVYVLGGTAGGDVLDTVGALSE